VRRRKKNEGLRGTHLLESAQRRNEDTEKKRASERHSPTRERRAIDKYEHGKKAKK
jgi:hypothetical protein